MDKFAFAKAGKSDRGEEKRPGTLRNTAKRQNIRQDLVYTKRPASLPLFGPFLPLPLPNMHL
jgi:hypothetical protein